MITLDLRVEAEGWNTLQDLEKLCQTALDAGAKIGGRGGEVSVLLTSDAAVHALNQQWRGKDKPTDILSFPADEMDRPFLGDMALAYGVTLADATARHMPLQQHLSHLLIHGYFHLMGHDHIDDKDAALMEALEIQALASLGWPDPYK